MASGGDRKLPELRIAYKQLEKRGRELSKGKYGGLQQQQSDGSLERLGGGCQDNFDATTSNKHELEHQKLGNSIFEEETSSKSAKAPLESVGGLFQIKPTRSADSRESGKGYAPGERNRHVSAERHRRGKSDCLWQQQSSARRSDVENRSLTALEKQETCKESDRHCASNARGLIQVDKSVLETASTRKRGGGRPGKGTHRAVHTGASGPLGGEGRRRHSSEGSPRTRGNDREKSALDSELAGLLADVKHCEGQMERAVSRWSGTSAGFDSLVKMCLRLQSSCEKLFFLDLEASAKHDIGSRLWRSAHYPIIEALRKRLQATDTEAGAVAGEVRGMLEQFLSDSVEFYTTLVKGLQRRHHFQLTRLVSAEAGSEFQSRTHRRKVMLAVFTCHWCYIHLGDLSRYQEQLTSKPDWSKPRSLYLKAQLLAPKDGKPYNQLAIVAINAQRRLDAVYYYMRSLMAKNPFLSAHDSLVGIFGETSLKAKRKEDQERVAREKAEREAARKKRKMEKRAKRQPHKRPQERERNEQLNPSSGRREVWRMPGSGGDREGGGGDSSRGNEADGGKGEGAVGGGDKMLGGESNEQTSSEELMKKLTSAFLVTHGRLFTKIGIETYEPVLGRLLRLWRGVLERAALGRGVPGGGASFQDASRFLKMMVINLFSIHHAVDRHTDDEAGRRYYCGLAFSLAAQFTAALMDTGSRLLDSLPDDSRLRRAGAVGDLSGSEEDSQSSGGKTKGEPKPGMPCNSKESTSSLADSDSQSRPSQVSDDTANISGRIDCARPETRLADASPAVLRVLDVLSLLLPTVRVWFDWLVLQRDLWLQFLSAVQRSVLHEFWSSAFAFLNRAVTIFDEFSAPPSCSKFSAPPSCTCPCLWEDKVLAGFMPLKASLTTEETFSIQDATRLSPHDHRLQCLMRISLLVEACRRLSVEAQLGISYDAAAGVFSRREGEEGGEAEEGTVRRDEGDVVSDVESESSGKDVIVESSSESETEGDNGIGQESGASVLEPQDETSAEIEQLKIRREMLARQIEERQLAEETAKTVLDEATNRESQEVCVVPRYLVPDTNCFVDMLPSILALVKLGIFTIAVPLTVLAELEGLGKDCERTDSARVSAGAKAALDYVTAAFSSRQSQVRVLTTHGSLLSSLSFRAELTGKATNDDLILESCLNLHAKVDRGKSTGNSEFYSVALLTDDRNLRVKAHASGLPVRDIPAFMRLVPSAKKL